MCVKKLESHENVLIKILLPWIYQPLTALT